MDRRERMGDLTLLLQGMQQGFQSGIWTALPAQYVGPGAGFGTANVQPTIQGRFIKQDGETWGPWVNLPVCPDCPISWPGGRRGRLVWPLVVGEEGLLVFASRAIDGWWLQGGPQPSSSPGRMHDLSDGIFFPGIFSQPNAPASVNPTPPVNLRLTSDDGLTYVELDDVGHIVTITAPGGIVLAGPVTFTEPVTFDEAVTFNDGAAITGVISGNPEFSGNATFDNAIVATGGVMAHANITTTAEVIRGVGGADVVHLGSHTHQYQEPTGGSVPQQTNAPLAGS